MTAQGITWMVANAGTIIAFGVAILIIIIVAFMAVLLWGLMR